MEESRGLHLARPDHPRLVSLVRGRAWNGDREHRRAVGRDGDATGWAHRDQPCSRLREHLGERVPRVRERGRPDPEHDRSAGGDGCGGGQRSGPAPGTAERHHVRPFGARLGEDPLLQLGRGHGTGRAVGERGRGFAEPSQFFAAALAEGQVLFEALLFALVERVDRVGADQRMDVVCH